MSDDWLKIGIAEAGFADRVVADIMAVVRTPSGRALFERLKASGRIVHIEKPALRDPPNASATPHDLRAAIAAGRSTGTADAAGQPIVGAGGGSDCTIAYDPRQWPSPIHPNSPTSDVLLLTLFQQALAHVTGSAAAVEGLASDAAALETEAIAQYRRERRLG